MKKAWAICCKKVVTWNVQFRNEFLFLSSFLEGDYNTLAFRGMKSCVFKSGSFHSS